MRKVLVAAAVASVAWVGAASAAPMQYDLDLTVGADTAAFDGLTAGSVFSGTVDLDPDFPSLTNGDGSLTNLLINLNGALFDQNAAVSADFVSVTTLTNIFSSDPLPFLADDPNGFMDILVRNLVMAGGHALSLSTNNEDDITWFAFDGNAGRVDGTFAISISAVPLPAALPILLSALAGLGLVGRRKNRASA